MGAVFSLNWGKPPRGASGHRRRSRGAGGRMRDAGRRAGAVHAPAGWAAQPSTGGRGNNGMANQPMGCRPLPGAIENPVRGDTNHTYTPSISSRAARFPSHRNRVGPLSERHAKSMSDKGGLGLFQTQQRHAETCRGVAETARAPHPSGVGLHSRPGVV